MNDRTPQPPTLGPRLHYTGVGCQSAHLRLPRVCCWRVLSGARPHPNGVTTRASADRGHRPTRCLRSAGRPLCQSVRAASQTRCADGLVAEPKHRTSYSIGARTGGFCARLARWPFLSPVVRLCCDCRLTYVSAEWAQRLRAQYGARQYWPRCGWRRYTLGSRMCWHLLFTRSEAPLPPHGTPCR